MCIDHAQDLFSKTCMQCCQGPKRTNLQVTKLLEDSPQRAESLPEMLPVIGVGHDQLHLHANLKIQLAATRNLPVEVPMKPVICAAGPTCCHSHACLSLTP